jgi:hypothetical protein
MNNLMRRFFFNNNEEASKEDKRALAEMDAQPFQWYTRYEVFNDDEDDDPQMNYKPTFSEEDEMAAPIIRTRLPNRPSPEFIRILAEKRDIIKKREINASGFIDAEDWINVLPQSRRKQVMHQELKSERTINESIMEHRLKNRDSDEDDDEDDDDFIVDEYIPWATKADILKTRDQNTRVQSYEKELEEKENERSKNAVRKSEQLNLDLIELQTRLASQRKREDEEFEAKKKLWEEEEDEEEPIDDDTPSAPNIYQGKTYEEIMEMLKADKYTLASVPLQDQQPLADDDNQRNIKLDGGNNYYGDTTPIMTAYAREDKLKAQREYEEL